MSLRRMVLTYVEKAVWTAAYVAIGVLVAEGLLDIGVDVAFTALAAGLGAALRVLAELAEVRVRQLRKRLEDEVEEVSGDA